MITLEKILTELRADSLNEITAGKGRTHNHGKTKGHTKSKSKSRNKSRSKSKKY